jgi:hypothetical protein
MHPMTSRLAPRIRPLRASFGSAKGPLLLLLCGLRVLAACGVAEETKAAAGVVDVDADAASDASSSEDVAPPAASPAVAASHLVASDVAPAMTRPASPSAVALADGEAPRSPEARDESAGEVATPTDPAAPPGGWFLDVTPAALPSGRPLPADARALGDGVSIAPVAPPDPEDDECAVHGVWAPVAGARREVFTTRLCAYEDVVGGVWTQGGERVVWLWNVSMVTLDVARFDATTGALVAPAVHVAATSHLEIECANVLEGLRPTPVRVGRSLGFALQWGGPELLYVAPGRRRGVLLRAAFPVPAPGDEVSAASYPSGLRLARCGRARCLVSED